LVASRIVWLAAGDRIGWVYIGKGASRPRLIAVRCLREEPVKGWPDDSDDAPMICMARTEIDLSCAASHGKTNIWPVLAENTSGHYVTLDHRRELPAGLAIWDHVDLAAGVVAAALPPVLLALL
jgi:hypothetical protein